MPKIAYQEHNFSSKSLDIIRQADGICAEYSRQGFTLTLRQLYYQFVSRGLIPNKDSEYKRLGSLINDARLAGLIDWYHIEDRTRHLRSVSHWSSPSDILSGVYLQYSLSKWKNQPCHVECWIEKDALVGVIERVCDNLDIPYFSCRGYTSQSEIWRAAMRLIRHRRDGKENIILHLGDHDPSGLDMTRDIQDRLTLFGAKVEIRRLALNMDQIDQYNPPPNPAKMTDARFEKYIVEHGDSSWELDALEPRVIEELIRDAVLEYRDDSLLDDVIKEEEKDRSLLRQLETEWPHIVQYLDEDLAYRGNEDDSDKDDDDDDWDGDE